MTLPSDFFADQKGVAAIQYALVAGVVSLAVLLGSLSLREPVLDLYAEMSGQAGEALTGQQSAGSPTEDQV
ncbi:MAG: hypothetical protein AAGA21_04600 [Pseudomonadota bacterium]